ncbi:hypothetical protein ACDI10_12800 [Vreelandella venusta]|uniref:hypothetical protein n=1 Tax=Vreelandella venusta TaxID=44935 RepID=UPI003556414C
MKKIVHIGQMKSGTTYIQSSLSQNRKLLNDSGFLYPGNLFNQQHACYGICGKHIPWVNPEKKWEELGVMMLDEIDKSDNDILISSEALSCMGEKGVESFINRIGGIDEVVVTVRNFHRVILSAWQQSIKGGGVRSLPEFIEYIRTDRILNKGMWKNYSFGETVKVWSKHAKVNVVVVGGDNTKGDLLDRFSEVCKLPELSKPKLKTSEMNKSLKREDVELLRCFNYFNKSMERNKKDSYIRWILHNGFFPASNLKEGSKIKIPKESVDEVVYWAKEEVEKIPAGINLVGFLEDIFTVNENDVEDVQYSNDDHLSRANYILRLIFESLKK